MSKSPNQEKFVKGYDHYDRKLHNKYAYGTRVRKLKSLRKHRIGK